MNIKQIFFTAFLIGVILGNFFFGEVQQQLFPSSIQINSAPYLSPEVRQDFQLQQAAWDVERGVSLITAGLLFASAYIIWRKYKTMQYFPPEKNRWNPV